MRSVASVGLGIVMALIVSEGFLRVLRPDLAPRTARLAKFWRHDEWLGWSHVPNVQGRFRAFGSETLVSINSQGFRDRERSRTRVPGKRRIVVIGDSMVWGYGVQQAEVFTALLEKRRPDLEVINFGVSGYGTDQELILLERQGVRYEPDLVVLVFVGNDFITNVEKSAYFVYHKPMYELSDDGHVTLTNIPVPPQRIWERAVSWFVQHTYAVNLAARSYAEVRVRLASAIAAPDPRRRPPFPRDASEKVTAALLLKLGRVATENRAVLVVVLADQLGLLGPEVEEFLKNHGIRAFSLDPYFPQARSLELHVRDGLHWSAQGHVAAADALFRYLLEEKLLVNHGR